MAEEDATTVPQAPDKQLPGDTGEVADGSPDAVLPGENANATDDDDDDDDDDSMVIDEDDPDKMAENSDDDVDDPFNEDENPNAMDMDDLQQMFETGDTPDVGEDLIIGGKEVDQRLESSDKDPVEQSQAQEVDVHMVDQDANNTARDIDQQPEETHEASNKEVQQPEQSHNTSNNEVQQQASLVDMVGKDTSNGTGEPISNSVAGVASLNEDDEAQGSDIYMADQQDVFENAVDASVEQSPADDAPTVDPELPAPSKAVNTAPPKNNDGTQVHVRDHESNSSNVCTAPGFGSTDDAGSNMPAPGGDNGHTNAFVPAEPENLAPQSSSNVNGETRSSSQKEIMSNLEAEPAEEETLFIPEGPPGASRPAPEKIPAPIPPPAPKQSISKLKSGRLSSMLKDARKKQEDARLMLAQRPNVRQMAQQQESTPAPSLAQEENDHRMALEAFELQRKHYEDLKKKGNGNLNFRHDVTWEKIQVAEKNRLRKRQRDHEFHLAELGQDGTGLHADDAMSLDGGPDLESDRSDPWGASQMLSDASSSRKRPRERSPSMQQAELRSMKVAMDAAKDTPKKKNQKGDGSDSEDQTAGPKTRKRGASRKSKVTKTKSTGSKAGKSGGKGKQKSKATSRAMDNAARQAFSLVGSNIFEQQARPGETEAHAGTTSRNKQTALREMIATLPIDDQKQGKSDAAQLINATRDFNGRGAVRNINGQFHVKGMKTHLKNFQVLGSAFMRRRENDSLMPRGGLLADQMGLGKTVMMLANIVNGRPTPGRGPRSTLIVASPNLLTQWASEIEAHTDCNLSVLRYCSGNRIDANNKEAILQQSDIILTTYHEIMKSYPKNEPPVECMTAEQKIAWWKAQFEERRGILHRMQFFRVVLDEAQAIKNHLSQTSIACRALMAKHKWALSGTPVLNSLTELYAYFKFLEVPHTGSFKIFKNNYCGSGDSESIERLLLRLSQFMLRRTHGDRLFNQPILVLPRAGQSTFWCRFNSVERCIYDIVRERFAYCINMWAKRNDPKKSYGNALVMLLRLRQLTAHVLMLQFVMEDLLEREDIEKIKDIVSRQAQDSTTQQGRTIIQVRKQLEQLAVKEKQKAAVKAAAKSRGEELEDASDEEEEEDITMEDAEADFIEYNPDGSAKGGCGEKFGKDYNFKPFLMGLKSGDSWEKAKKKARCSYCKKVPVKPWIQESCGHLICGGECMEKTWLAQAEVDSSLPPCGNCGRIPTCIQPCEEDDSDDEGGPVATGTRAQRAKKGANNKKKAKQDDIPQTWLDNIGADILPSAKTIAVKAQILNWRKENPDVKIIVYTQFLPM